jgi:hypothetical protein
MEVMNTNTVQILKNYLRFASGARYRTAQIYLKELETSDHLPTQKLMMARIVQEVIASTEDLAMWLVAIHERNAKNPRYKDIMQKILTVKQDRDNTKILKGFKRIKTADGLLKKLNLPSVNVIAKEKKSTENEIGDGILILKNAIDKSLYNREVSDGVLLRFYNKIKHGMMIFHDPSDASSIWIHDYWSGYSNSKKSKRKRIVRKNRDVFLKVDIAKAKIFVGTIKAFSQAIQELIRLALFDLEYQIKTGRMRKKTKENWLKEFKRSEF